MKRQITSAVLAGSAAVAALAGFTAAGASTSSLADTATATGGSRAALAPVTTLHLKPSSGDLEECFPNARSRVDVALTTDDIGKDTFTIHAWGLKKNTDFTIFLVQKATTPFGAVEYIGDMTTDRWGKAHNTFKLIAEEAFAFNNETGIRKELNKVGFWFADPKDDNGCLGAGSPVTQFDGDASAGVQMMNSGRQRLP